MATRLPEYIIEMILCSEKLTISDVVNFSLTNRYHSSVVINNMRIWKKKYLQTWPQFSEVLDKHISIHNWYEEVQSIFNLKQKTRPFLYSMPCRFYARQHPLTQHELTEWLELYQEKPQMYYYLVDDLMTIVNTRTPINTIEIVPISTPGNLTLEYYAMETLMFLRKFHLTKEWKLLPQKQLTLEKCAVFILQWHRPNKTLSLKKFETELDQAAEEVKDDLKMIHPNHPVFAVSEERLKMWRDGNIKGNKYGEKHCVQIVQVLDKFQFRLEEFLEAFNNHVHGANIFKQIANESVARRLGVKWQPIQTSAEYCYYTMELSKEYDIEDDDDSPVSATTLILKRLAVDLHDDVLPHLQDRYSYDATRSVRNLSRICSLYELLLLINPYNAETFTNLTMLYRDYNMDCTILIESLMQKMEHLPYPDENFESILSTLKQYQNGCNVLDLSKNVRKTVRPSHLKYAVGMVMNYYNQLGVICGWDPNCLSSEGGQPLYKILMAGGTYNISEDKLKPAVFDGSCLLSKFDDVGRHFSHFFETHFVPNAEKEREYPNDEAVRHAYHQKLKSRVKRRKQQ